MSSPAGFRHRAMPHSFFVSALALAVMTGGCTNQPRGVPASEGIANFGQVSGSLYRGAQPDERGLENLQRLGVATIINLRMPDDVWPEEAASARRHGMVYLNFPLHGFSAPTDAEVSQVLSLIESSPAPVFIHCEHGADRTGTMVACYRMRHDGWTPERALAEARSYGLSGWEFGMKRTVRDFPTKSANPQQARGAEH